VRLGLLLCVMAGLRKCRKQRHRSGPDQRNDERRDVIQRVAAP